MLGGAGNLPVIGFIGTGIMGSSMVSNILKSGYQVHVYNRSKSKIFPLLEKGAIESVSIRNLVDQATVICTMLGYPRDVESVVIGEVLPVIGKGKYLIDFTTSQPSLAVQIAELAKSRECVSLDAPVSGGDLGARNGTLSIMIGASDSCGEKEKSSKSLDLLMPFLLTMGKTIRLMGGPGMGQHAKMGNQVVVASNTIGFVESLFYAHKAGLDLHDFVSVISNGAASSRVIDLYGERLIKRDLNPGFKIEHFVKDLGIVLDETKRMGITLPGMQLAFQLYSTLMSEKDSQLGTQGLILALERMNNSKPMT